MFAKRAFNLPIPFTNTWILFEVFRKKHIFKLNIFSFLYILPCSFRTCKRKALSFSFPFLTSLLFSSFTKTTKHSASRKQVQPSIFSTSLLCPFPRLSLAIAIHYSGTHNCGTEITYTYIFPYTTIQNTKNKNKNCSTSAATLTTTKLLALCFAPPPPLILSHCIMHLCSAASQVEERVLT